MLSIHFSIALLSSLVASVAWVIWQSSGSPRRLPPGPYPWPILGNALKISSRAPWISFEQWGRRYGPVFSASILASKFIIINSSKAASEILDKNSFNSSGRPAMLMASLTGWEKLLPLLNPSSRLKNTRSLLHQTLNLGSIEKYAIDQERGAAIFTSRLLLTPVNLTNEIRRTVAIGIGRMIYGFEVSAVNAPFIDLAEEALQVFGNSTRPNHWLVDAFPLMRYIPAWLPGASWKRKANTWKKYVTTRIVEEPFLQALKEIDNGKALPSFVSQLTELEDKSALSSEMIDTIKWAASSAYLGGTETSVSVLSTFFLAMILYPEVQRKAQMEIDTVIGGERLPTFEDRPSLPFIDCILKETLRWQPSVPLVFPHLINADFRYDGMLIPGGSVIVANSWAMLRDPVVYPDPDNFQPERYLEADVPDPAGYSFGYGRRICPGIAVAQKSLWITMATTLAVLNTSCPEAPDGTPIKPQVFYTPGPMRHPLHFHCAIVPRQGATSRAMLERGMI